MYLSFQSFVFLILVAMLGGVFTFAVLVTALIYETKLKLLEESNRKAELQRLLAQAELARLQGQVRPHFIFNVLNSVARLIDMDRLEQASSTVISLGALLRHGLRQSRPLVTLAEEMRLVEHYLAIQTLRFGDRVQVRFDLPDELLSVSIPALSVQELVDNAFSHGVENRSGAVEITVRAWHDGNRAIIEVTDNGTGISAAALTAFRSWKTNHETEVSGLGVGLRTLHRRVQLLFGSSYGLTLEPWPAGGTAARLSLPFAQGERSQHDTIAHSRR